MYPVKDRRFKCWLFADFLPRLQAYAVGGSVDDADNGNSYNYIKVISAKSQGEADIVALKSILLFSLEEKGILGMELGMMSKSKMLDNGRSELVTRGVLQFSSIKDVIWRLTSLVKKLQLSCSRWFSMLAVNAFGLSTWRLCFDNFQQLGSLIQLLQFYKSADLEDRIKSKSVIVVMVIWQKISLTGNSDFRGTF